MLKEIKNTPYNPEHVRSYYKNILQIKLYVKKLKFLSGVWLLGFWVSFVDFGVPGPRSRLRPVVVPGPKSHFSGMSIFQASLGVGSL